MTGRLCYGRRVDVLVVDPTELGELLTVLLGEYGLSVRRASSGEEALGRALDERPKVVVVEADLPDTSGLDLAELFRGELGAKVVLTYEPGFGIEDAGIGPRISNLDASFTRPFRSLDLIQRVAELAGRELPGSQEGDPVLTSADGYAVDVLADDLGEDIVFDDESDVFSSESTLGRVDEADHVLFGEATLQMPPQTLPNEMLLVEEDGDDEDVHTNPALMVRPSHPRSAEAARPLSEVEGELERRQSGVFSPGELAELWQRTRERRAGPVAPPSATGGNDGRFTPRLLADLCDAFHQSQTSGELWLESGPGRRVLLFRRGVLAGARSNMAGEDLVSQLRRRQLITDDDAEQIAFVLQAKQYPTAVSALLALGFITPEVLQVAVDDYVRRVAIGAFTWASGKYRLTLDGRASREALPARVNIGDVVVHAILLTEKDASLEKAAPEDARFAPVGDATYGLEHLRLSPFEARVVIAMDGTKTIGDLLTLFGPLSGADGPDVDGRASAVRTVRGLAAGLFCLHLTRFVGRGPAAARRISFF